MIYMTDQYLLGAVNTNSLNKARILWDNKLASATFTATNNLEGFEPVNARATDTASWWWAAAAATLTMTFSSATLVSSVCISAHTLGTTGALTTIQGLIGGTWVTLHPQFSASDNEPVMVMFQEVSATAVRLVLSDAARIGVVYAGQEMIMPQMVYTSSTALGVSLNTMYETNRSQTGQFLGRSIIANARPFNATWTHLYETWVRGVFYSFILAARRDPFFIALRPGGYPADTGYIWTSSDIVPQRMGTKNYMQVQVTGEAHMGAEV